MFNSFSILWILIMIEVIYKIYVWSILSKDILCTKWRILERFSTCLIINIFFEETQEFSRIRNDSHESHHDFVWAILFVKISREYNIFLQNVICHFSLFIYFFSNRRQILRLQWLFEQFESFFFERVNQTFAEFLKWCEIQFMISWNWYLLKRFSQSFFLKQHSLFRRQRDETFFWIFRVVFWSWVIWIRIAREKFLFVSQT